MRAAQQGTNLCQQGVLHCCCQVAGAYLCRVGLSASGARYNNGRSLTAAMGNHRRFHTGLVNGVDDHVESGQQDFCHIFGGDEILNADNITIGVDQLNAFSHGINFGFTINAAKGMNLPVRIGFGHHIEVDRNKMPDAGSRQRFKRPGTDSANPDDADSRTFESFCRDGAVEAGNTAEAALAINCHHGGKPGTLVMLQFRDLVEIERGCRVTIHEISL